MTTSFAIRTLGTIVGAAAAAATWVVALAPAWVPARAGDALRVVELPRVVVAGQRERAAPAPRVVELPRVVIAAERHAAPAGGSLPANGGVQPVMNRALD
ncbi:MAG TPA: hypothetical protein VFR90_02025 [Methylibium sp.]|uniref:hypothetical protein n=1 Tax=Methylibium sp. TaxID=2067992 RepID=UPI002DBC6580|nr:hypothetical protein [Methylibium sp.]HEU4457879.1 hypothetical protein [Methylibium sp.]